ncbi:hypothetical protein D3C76_1263150 [compost metagenome]
MVKTQGRAEDDVAQALLVLGLAVHVHLQVDEGHQRGEGQAAAEHFLLGDPDQARRDDIGAHAKIHRQAAAVIAAQGVGLVVGGEHLAVQTGRRHGAGHVVLGAHGVGGTAALGGLGHMTERGEDAAGQGTQCGAHRQYLLVFMGVSRRPRTGRGTAGKAGQMRLNRAERVPSPAPSAAVRKRSMKMSRSNSRPCIRVVMAASIIGGGPQR